VNDLAGVARNGAEEGPVAVHDDEAELLVALEQVGQGLGVELVVAEVERGVDGPPGLDVDVDLLFLAFVGEDGAAVDEQAVLWHAGVELQPFWSGVRESGCIPASSAYALETRLVACLKTTDTHEWK
jgi:hypothetical protein